jgi:hypothetical protein
MLSYQSYENHQQLDFQPENILVKLTPAEIIPYIFSIFEGRSLTGIGVPAPEIETLRIQNFKGSLEGDRDRSFGNSR